MELTADSSAHGNWAKSRFKETRLQAAGYC
jgi:hypothetical protein